MLAFPSLDASCGHQCCSNDVPGGPIGWKFLKLSPTNVHNPAQPSGGEAESAVEFQCDHTYPDLSLGIRHVRGVIL